MKGIFSYKIILAIVFIGTSTISCDSEEREEDKVDYLKFDIESFRPFKDPFANRTAELNGINFKEYDAITFTTDLDEKFGKEISFNKHFIFYKEYEYTAVNCNATVGGDPKRRAYVSIQGVGVVPSEFAGKRCVVEARVSSMTWKFPEHACDGAHLSVILSDIKVQPKQ